MSDTQDQRCNTGVMAAVFFTHRARKKTRHWLFYLMLSGITLVLLAALVVWWNIREQGPPKTATKVLQSEDTPSSIAARATKMRGTVKDTLDDDKSAKNSQPTNMMRVKYGGITHVQTQAFSSSVAFWQSECSLVIVFRNFTAPMNDASVEPTPGRAKLVVIIRTNGLEITPGTYQLGMLNTYNTYGAYVLPMQDKEDKKSMYLFPINAAWEVNDGGKIKIEFWKDEGSLPPAQFSEMLKHLGTVTLNEVGQHPGDEVVGTISLGSEEHINMAVGTFRVPVLAPPQDFCHRKPNK